MTDKPTRILIADDHPVFRFGMRALIEAQEDMVVVGEAETGNDVIEKATSLVPDIILMDINMPEVNGIEATYRILKSMPDMTILIITMFDDDTVFTAMQAGAQGYLLKGAQGGETLRAIRAVANGEVIFSPGVAKQMMRYFAGGKKSEPDTPFPELTPREIEILDLVAQGLTNNAIAERLVLSSKTIRNHVSNIFGKLQVASRSEAIIKAREAGLGNSDE